MGRESAPTNGSFAIGWLRVCPIECADAFELSGETTYVMRDATLGIIRNTGDVIELFLMIRDVGSSRIWSSYFDREDACGALTWIHECLVSAGLTLLASDFMGWYQRERNCHEKGERRMVTSMSMLDFLQKMAYSAKLTKDRFGEIMHGDYSEDEKQRALEQMEMAGGYDNLADD